MINRELEQLNSGGRRSSICGENLSSLSDEQLRQRIDMREKIDTEFGPIQLDQEEVG